MRDPGIVIDQLAHNKAVFQALFAHVPEEQVRWKPAPDKWSLLEVACHLYDEEREDFRARVRQTLEAPGESWPPIDPVGWVRERRYSEQDFNLVVAEFLREREESIGWLASLTSPNWNNTYQHPKVGPVSARLLLNNWLAHDYFHFRQITRLKYHYLEEAGGQPLDYAGAW
jgi:hypothetical protein